jgi:Family of unknown function (DUF6152)
MRKHSRPSVPSILLSVLATVSLAAGRVAVAHHSAATYDRDKVITLAGTIETVEWTNPHIWLWVRVQNQSDGSDLWGVEAPDVGSMTRHGWKKQMLIKGDKVSVDIHPMKDGRKAGSMVKVTFPDGRVLSPFESGGPPSPVPAS